MQEITAHTILSILVKNKLMKTQMTTFMVPRNPIVFAPQDIKEAFIVLAKSYGAKETDYEITSHFGVEFFVKDRFFETMLETLFFDNRVLPLPPEDGSSSKPNARGPLPSLPPIFIGSEKTLIRQIPYATKKPWPFHFLLELGGMIVVKTDNIGEFLDELKQFINNHPRLMMKIDAKECPDGSIVVFTYWCERVKSNIKRRQNINVPDKRKRL